MRTIKYILAILFLAILLYSCKKERITKVMTCGTVWDKGYERRGWYLQVDDRQVFLDSATVANTAVLTQYCR